MADLKIEIELNDIDEKIILSHLVDIDKWVLSTCTEKVDNCWKRFREKWTTILLNDSSFTDPIPSNRDALVSLVIKRSDYKDRSKRDEEEKIK